MEDSASMMNVCGVPCKSSDLLVIGRDHDWLESEKKLMVFCRYCDGVIQRESLPSPSLPLTF